MLETREGPVDITRVRPLSCHCFGNKSVPMFGITIMTCLQGGERSRAFWPVHSKLS